jgi:hypothetical protein
MEGWKSIATAPREPARPLLLYPRPQRRESQEPRAAEWIRNVSGGHEKEEDHDLEDDELEDDELEDDEEEEDDHHSVLPAIYASAFEGYWDGSRWRTSTGMPCEPTHWMPMPAPPLTLV